MDSKKKVLIESFNQTTKFYVGIISKGQEVIMGYNKQIKSRVTKKSMRPSQIFNTDVEIL